MPDDNLSSSGRMPAAAVDDAPLPAPIVTLPATRKPDNAALVRIHDVVGDEDSPAAAAADHTVAGLVPAIREATRYGRRACLTVETQHTASDGSKTFIKASVHIEKSEK